MKNKLKEVLDSGNNALGTFVWSANACAAECLGYAGLDYIIIDSEHSPIDTENAADMIRAAKLHGLTPVVRTKDHQRTSVLKMLDLGAEALIIPNLHTIDEVKQAVDFAKYTPIGRRGFAQCREAGYGFEAYAADLNNYLEVSNRETLLLPMCETESLLNCIEEVVSMPGVDGVFVGPYDLSLDMGMPGKFDAQECQAALRRIARACRNADKYAFIYSSSAELARNHIDMGYQAPAIGIDTQMLIRAYRRELANVRRNTNEC